MLTLEKISFLKLSPKIVQNMDSSIRRISHYLERIHVSIKKTNFVIHY